MKKIVIIAIFLIPSLVFPEINKLNILKDRKENPTYRAAAARMLAKDKVKEAIPVLLDIIKDLKEETKLRIACAAALGKIGDKEVIPEYLEIIGNGIKDEDEVKVACINAIASLDDKDSLFQLGGLLENFRKDIEGKLANTIIDALLKSKYKKEEDVIMMIGAAITHPKDDVRKRVITILTESNNILFLPMLMISARDKVPEVREAAIKAVAKIGGKMVVPSMIESLTEENHEKAREIIAGILNELEVGRIKPVWIEVLNKIIMEEKNSKIKIKLTKALERISKAQKMETP